MFVRYKPNCAVSDVSEALDMAGGTAGRLLRELSEDCLTISTMNNVQFIYTAAPRADIPGVILLCLVLKSVPG